MIFGLLLQTVVVASVVPPDREMGDHQHPNNITVSPGCLFNFSYKTKVTGMFSSPNFPNNYPDNIMCSYFFQASPSGRIQITFDTFSLEKPSDKGCYFDYLEIYNVREGGYRSLRDRYCGISMPKNLISDYPALEIFFVSDFTKNSNGFLGHFTFLLDNWHNFGPSSLGCGAGYLMGVGGVISSPGHPELSVPRTQCTWIINVEESEKILLTLVEMKGVSSSNCAESKLEIYNGFAVPGMLAEETYCTPKSKVSKERQEVVSTTNRAVVRFHVGTDGNMLAFKLTWTAVRLVQKDGHDITDKCDKFLCKAVETLCVEDNVRCNLPVFKLCIDKSLQCNDLPNCGSRDNSDEEGCMKKILLIVVFAAVPTVIVILVIIIVICCCHRHRRKQLHVIKTEKTQQTHWVSPHARNAEHSPVSNRSPLMHTTSFISSKHSFASDSKHLPNSDVKKESKRVTIVDDVEKKDMTSSEKNNVNGGVRNLSNDVSNKHKVTPCGDNSNKEEVTHVQLEPIDRLTPKHFRTHQKRPSYHLMQELNMDGVDIAGKL